MLIHGINDNTLVYHPSDLGIYQYEAKMRALKEINMFWGCNQTKKMDKTTMHIYPSTLGLNVFIPLNFESVLGVLGFFIYNSKYWWINMH